MQSKPSKSEKARADATPASLLVEAMFTEVK